MGDSISSSSSDNDVNTPLLSTPVAPLSASQSPASYGGDTSSSNAQSDIVEVKIPFFPPPSLNSSSSSSSSSLELLNDSDISATSCSSDQAKIEAVTHAPSDWTADDRCPYYPVRSDGCTEPRSCRDCLNVDVGDEYSCMVNQYGRCVQKNPSTYVKNLDFECQEASNDGQVRIDQKVQFPSYKVDYCRHEDKKCRDQVFSDVMEGRIDGSLTKFCYGKGGCVCIAVCEAPIWKETIGQTVCNGTVVNRDYESQYANAYGELKAEDGQGPGLSSLMAGMVGGLAAVFVLVAAVFYVRRRRTESRDSAIGEGNNLANAQDRGEDGATGDVPMVVPASTLSLFGWQAMRSELIEREQLLLAGVEDFSNVRTGYLQLLDVDASAPPQEEDESSAPVLLVPLTGASAPSFSPRGVAAFASAPSAPPASPSAPLASPTLVEEELL